VSVCLSDLRVHNTDNVLTFRGLRSEQRGSVPAIVSLSSFRAGPLLTVLDGVLLSTTSRAKRTRDGAGGCAVVNGLSGSTTDAAGRTVGNLLLRNVSTPGYACAVQNGSAASALRSLPPEYATRRMTPDARTLGLKVLETPPPAQPRDGDVRAWWLELSSLGQFGNDTSDSTPALRAAMASRRPGVILAGHDPLITDPRDFGRQYYLSGTVTVRAPVV